MVHLPRRPIRPLAPDVVPSPTGPKPSLAQPPGLSDDVDPVMSLCAATSDEIRRLIRARAAIASARSIFTRRSSPDSIYPRIL
jgi:hypothetical protein